MLIVVKVKTANPTLKRDAAKVRHPLALRWSKKKEVMIYRKILYLYMCVFIMVPTTAFAGWFGPSDYDECIIEGMKGVQSDVAARLVRQSCLKKFPPQKDKTPKSEKIPQDSKENLSGHTGIGSLGYFSGNIYNGNSDWTVTELIINISEKDWFEKAINKKEGAPDPRMDKYRIEVTILPYTSKDFTISVDWPKDEPYEWNIYEARGYK